MTTYRLEPQAPANGHTPDGGAPKWRLLVVGGLVVFVLWHIVTKELPDYLAAVSPEAALILDASHPVALTTLADRQLNGEGGANAQEGDIAPDTTTDALGRWAALAWPAIRNGGAAPPPRLSDADRARIQSMASTALLRDPLNARALRILGQLADAAGDKPTAERYMRAAVRRSARSTYAVNWLMAESARKKNDADVLRYADLLLRKRPQLGRAAYPLLADIAERSAASSQDDLVALLASNPPWRAAFFAGLPNYIRDARTPLSLLLALKQTSAPPSAAEVNGYLKFLTGKKLYEFAYYVWLQFLGPEALPGIGLLVNGSFETPPTGAPFDWEIRGGRGVTIDLAERMDADGDRALYLELGPGRVQFRGVSQLVTLSPGKYRLTGRLQGELTGRRGLKWTIACLPSAKPAGETSMFLGAAPEWTPFETQFVIPAENCSAQELRLILASRSPSEELAAGAVWYDGLKLVRENDEPQP